MIVFWVIAVFAMNLIFTLEQIFKVFAKHSLFNLHLYSCTQDVYINK